MELQEDERVTVWVQLNGTNDWAGCSAQGCTKQCKERWTHTLNPNIKKAIGANRKMKSFSGSIECGSSHLPAFALLVVSSRFIARID